jgi:hypothetical protein
LYQETAEVIDSPQAFAMVNGEPFNQLPEDLYIPRRAAGLAVIFDQTAESGYC